MGQAWKQPLWVTSRLWCTASYRGKPLLEQKRNEKIRAMSWRGRDWKWMRSFEPDDVTQVPAHSKGLGAPWRTQVLNLLLPTISGGLLDAICHHDVTAEPNLCPSMQFRWSFIICSCCERNEPHTGCSSHSRVLHPQAPVHSTAPSDGTGILAYSINKEQLPTPDSQQNYRVPQHLYPGYINPRFVSRLAVLNLPIFSS